MSNYFISLCLILVDNLPPVDLVRASLAATSDKWFTLLLFSSAIVALGCVLEIGETWAELKTWWIRKKDKTAERPSWRIPIAAIGLLLVIAGVIGEGIFEGLVSINDTALRAHDEKVLADTIKEAGSAKDSADAAATAAKLAKNASGNAQDKANKAIRRANAVFSTAARADLSARGAFTLATGAQAEVAKTEAAIKTTEANVERVDEKFAFRTLSATKRDIIVHLLKNASVKPDNPVEMQAFISVQDGATYGEEIAAAINDPQTGWKASQVALAARSGNVKGVVLLAHDMNSLPPWALSLQQALMSAGVGGVAVYTNDQPAGTLTVLICPKN